MLSMQIQQSLRLIHVNTANIGNIKSTKPNVSAIAVVNFGSLSLITEELLPLGRLQNRKYFVFLCLNTCQQR